MTEKWGQIQGKWDFIWVNMGIWVIRVWVTHDNYQLNHDFEANSPLPLPQGVKCPTPTANNDVKFWGKRDRQMIMYQPPGKEACAPPRNGWMCEDTFVILSQSCNCQQIFVGHNISYQVRGGRWGIDECSILQNLKTSKIESSKNIYNRKQ